MSLVDDDLDRRLTEAFSALDDVTVLRRPDTRARRGSRVRPVFLAVGCVAALAVAVVVVASRRDTTPATQSGATVGIGATAAAPSPLDAGAMQRLAIAGLLTPDDVPARLARMHADGVGGHPKCINKRANQLAGASARGQALSSPAFSRYYQSWAWAFVDAATASKALRTAAASAAIDCYFRTSAARSTESVGGVDNYDYIRIAAINDLPPIGDEAVVFRVADKITNERPEQYDFVFVRSGAVLAVAILADTRGPTPVATVKAMFDNVAARVKAEEAP